MIKNDDSKHHCKSNTYVTLIVIAVDLFSILKTYKQLKKTPLRK